MSLATMETISPSPDHAPSKAGGRRFEIRSAAISLVDPKQPKPKPLEAPTELVHLSQYRPGQKKIIENFLDRHLSRAWELPERSRTRSANFEPGSPISQAREKLQSNPRTFLREARSIANRLLQVTPSTASRGVLLTLWFEEGGSGQSYLGLFKLDPGKRDTIFLEKGSAGEILLRIAADHQEYALPEPGDRVLKWAIVPHPVRGSRYAIKLRDEQGDRDPAFYFVKFLACKDFVAEGDQAAAAIQKLLEHSKDKRRLQAPKKGVPRVVANAKAETVAVTEAKIVKWAIERKLITKAEQGEFQNRLSASKAKGMRVSPAAFRNLQMEYHLTAGDGVIISGRLADLLSLVNVRREGPEFVFEIATPSYQVEVKP